MEASAKTARELYQELRERPPRPRLGFGRRTALINVDIQNAYTAVGEFRTAYETDPNQIAWVNEIARLMRGHGLPVVWTYVAYLPSGEDCGTWGLRSDTPDSLQNIAVGSRRAALDDRCEVDPAHDIVWQKRMASSFFETPLCSLLTFHRIDTVIVTGGSTSGCVRATVVDAISHGYHPIVPEECVADKHESPHFASLYDMALKYADVMPVAEVLEHLRAHTPAPLERRRIRPGP